MKNFELNSLFFKNAMINVFLDEYICSIVIFVFNLRHETKPF